MKTDNTKGKKRNQLLTSPNPIAMASAGLEATPSSPMPPAIHGGLAEESSIDYPVSNGLCQEVWEQKGDTWTIKSEIKLKALELVDVLLAKYKVEAKGVNVVGSICSNQYTDDADIDIHIQVDIPKEVAEALNKLRKLEQDELFKDVNLFVVGEHPLEFYFQPNIYADMGSCGCYDLMNDKWLSGPQIVELEFDPYEEYEESWNEAFEFGVQVQTALFNLHKNIYKYTAILEQASNRDIYSDEYLMSMVGRRLEKVKEEIRESMRVVAELKEQLVMVRRRANMNPVNSEQAEEMRTNKEWLTANSTFKFLQRLDVIDDCWLGAELYQAMENGDIEIDAAIQQLLI